MQDKTLDFDLFKDFPDPVFVMAPDGTILATNQPFLSRFDYLHDSLIGINVFDLLAEHQAPARIIANRKEKVAEVLRTGKHLSFDEPMRGEFWRSSMYPVFASSGKIAKLLVFVQNVTEQRLAEIEHENFLAKMKYALESSGVSVWSYDIEHDILLRTVQHDHIFGYDSLVPNWKIERFFGHILPEDIPMVKRQYENSMVNQRDFNLECRIRRVDGELRWINLVGTFRFDKPGASKIIVGIILDITEKKRAALELEKLQAQLQQSQKMELLGQLAGGIAHDFNNSLTAIIGNIELALAKTDPLQPVAVNLKDAHESAMRSANLTKQLLGFARKQMMQPVPINLNKVLKKLIPMLKRVISPQIKCILQPDPAEIMIFIDPAQLDQVLSNLCINARDAIEKLGVITFTTSTVRVSKQECAKGHACQSPGEYAVISVSDTGHGIDSKTLPHIFEPFFTTKAVGKGTGLGLSTVYGIVRQNNGYIACQTEPGKGATFNVYFPTHRQGGEPANPLEREPVIENASETVLLVEDESSILHILKEALEEAGFNVLAALDAESAIAMTEQHKSCIDLLVTDIVLPRMTGIELSKQLQERIPELKSLFMSGFAFDDSNRHTESLKPGNFIRKPFAIQEFMNMIYQSLMKM